MKQKTIFISEDLRAIINGYVMGDGHIKPQGTLTVDQGEKQLEFVEWSWFFVLKPICTETSAVKLVTRTRNGKQTKSYRFNTRAVLQDYYSTWYRPVEGESPSVVKKKLPTNIDDMFSPLFITVWFACDGTKIIGSRGAKFEVTSFSVEERHILKTLFKSKYNISVNILRSGRSCTYDKFYNLITHINYIKKTSKFLDPVTTLF